MGLEKAIQNEIISVIDIENASPFSWFDWWNYWSNIIFIVIFIGIFSLLSVSYYAISPNSKAPGTSVVVKQIEDANVDTMVRNLLIQNNSQNVLEYNNGA